MGFVLPALRARAHVASAPRGTAPRAAVLLGLVLLVGCPAEDADRTPLPALTDDAGVRVELSEPAHRIVSLVPAVTEMVAALGASDRLIARTRYDRGPGLDSLPSVGGGLTPNVEWLLARRPDLVVGWADGHGRTTLARLRELGVACYGARIDTIEDIHRTVGAMGRLLGLESTADSLQHRIRSDLSAVAARAPSGTTPHVLYLLSLDPVLTVGPGTFLDQAIELAGGRNVFADARGPWPQVGLEEVVSRGADVILVAIGEGLEGDPVARLRREAGWRELEAVRSGRVHPVDADLFHRPGPRIARVAEEIAGLLHPAAGGRP